ncbi:DNA cytosine methyltransferase [Phreatobacter sp. HK31-P]
MDGLVIDSFAGGGGASLGITAALGREPDFAINHNPEALALHEANHPTTVHLTEDVWKVNPTKLAAGKPVAMLWMSPDCRHFSKAKGSAPVSKAVRGLAWVALRWAKTVRPKVIFLENVSEFQDWGPLTRDGKPCLKRKGQTFADFVTKLERQGYRVEKGMRKACNDGSPTVRDRLVIVARCDGLPIVWPEGTHAAPGSAAVARGAKLPWKTAAGIIDWSLVTPSIFDTAEQIYAQHKLRAKRPLEKATLARIAKGVKRYVLDAATPFIVGVGGRMGQSAERPVTAPFQTVTSKADSSIVAPTLAIFRHDSDGQSLETPMPTITANSFLKRAGGAAPLGLIAPVLSYAQQGGRSRSPEDPVNTITASVKDQNQIIAPHLMTMRNSQKPHTAMDEPSHTVTSQGAGLSMVAPFLVPRYGERPGQEPRTMAADQPIGTVVPTGNQGSLAAVFLTQNNTGMVGHAVEDPLSTIVGLGSTQSVVEAALLTNFYGSNVAGNGDIDQPLSTVTAEGGHQGRIGATLVPYYGTERDGQAMDEPVRVVTSKARFALADVSASMPPMTDAQLDRARQVAAFLRGFGCWDEREFVTVGDFIVADIGLRMLTPRELARAQGFPDSYKLDIMFRGKPLSRGAQTRMIGNSVCPQVAEALVRANVTNAASLKAAPTYKPWGDVLKRRLIAAEQASRPAPNLFETMAEAA